MDMLFDYIEKYKEVQGAMIDSLMHLSEITRDEKVPQTFLNPSLDFLNVNIIPHTPGKFYR